MPFNGKFISVLLVSGSAVHPKKAKGPVAESQHLHVFHSNLKRSINVNYLTGLYWLPKAMEVEAMSTRAASKSFCEPIYFHELPMSNNSITLYV